MNPHCNAGCPLWTSLLVGWRNFGGMSGGTKQEVLSSAWEKTSLYAGNLCYKLQKLPLFLLATYTSLPSAP